MKRIGGVLLTLLMANLLVFLLEIPRFESAVMVRLSQQSSEAERQLALAELGGSGTFARLMRSLRDTFTLNWGETINKEPVLPLVQNAVLITLQLSSGAALLALVYGFLLPVAASGRKRLLGMLDAANELLLGMPVFAIALALLWIFALIWPVFPPAGTEMGGWQVLPVAVLALRAGSRLYVFSRRYFDQEIRRPHIRTLRAAGIASWRLAWLHTGRNMAAPVFSFWLVDFASYLAGAAVTETLFALPGLGGQIVEAVQRYDTRLTSGCLNAGILLVALTTAAGDTMRGWLTPEAR